MGCGKTTLGRALRDSAGLPFTDLDDAVEARAGMSIRRIFETDGESAFRDLERQVLRDLAGTPGIIACGGGTPCQPGNMELMNSLGVTVWLQAPVAVLTRRLSEDGGQRPLLAGLSGDSLRDFVVGRLADRTRYYSQATHTFDSSRLETAPQVAESVARFTEKILEKI